MLILIASLKTVDPVDGVFDSKTVVDGLKVIQGQVAAAASILIVGGGPVGVELAGTIY